MGSGLGAVEDELMRSVRIGFATYGVPQGAAASVRGAAGAVIGSGVVSAKSREGRFGRRYAGSGYSDEPGSVVPCTKEGGFKCSVDEQIEANDACHDTYGTDASSCCRFRDGTSDIQCKDKGPILGSFTPRFIQGAF